MCGVRGVGCYGVNLLDGVALTILQNFGGCFEPPKPKPHRSPTVCNLCLAGDKMSGRTFLMLQTDISVGCVKC
jgi:hypothetical protein